MTITLDIAPDREVALRRQAGDRGLPVDQYVLQVIDEGIALHTGQSPAEKVRALLDEWAADESGYEDEAWPRVKKAIDDNRLSSRSRYRD
jgi:hypothetical protein